jgi:hypothetical protein
MPDSMGYAHPRYALSLREFGTPRKLPRCGGWILVRQIPGTPYRDAMGCYPLFACRDWFKLHEDLEEIESELVSLTLVTDPFGDFDQGYLARYFQMFKPFKRHFIADLSQDPERFVDKHHRYYARKSLRDMQVEVCDKPLQYVDEWVKLYDNLIIRHNISGIKAFSKDSFCAQMQTPGVTLLIGRLGGEVVGAHMIIIRDDIAYSHLAAFSDDAYKCRASYGIYWMTLKYLKDHDIRNIDLGAIAGFEEDPKDGLAKFKAGWSNESRPVYFCGRVFSPEKYETITIEKGISTTDYFPAYRRGEFS